METLELIGGDRVAQTYFITKYFRDHPLELLTGQGMGGMIRNQSIVGANKENWKEISHFIEGAYPEVLYRSGIIGLLLYISIFAYAFFKAFQRRKENIFFQG